MRTWRQSSFCSVFHTALIESLADAVLRRIDKHPAVDFADCHLEQ